jgi:CubicO group peptidase (beta-lactamase class C family)
VVARLVSAGRLGLGDRGARYLQPLGVGAKSTVTLAQLLSHSAGFPAGVCVFDEVMRAQTGVRPGILSSSGAKQLGYTIFNAVPLKYEPGTRQLPSSVGAVVAGQVCENVTGLPLDQAFTRLVAAPLGVRQLSFIDLAAMWRKKLSPMYEIFAPMGVCERRGRMMVGEVWDRSAWAMGGVVGHSGCFGTAADLHTWGRELIKGYRGQSELLSAEVVRTLWAPELPGIRPGWRLGFDGSTREGGFLDAAQVPSAVVISSSTGCSVLLDPSRELVVVLVSNAGFGGQLHRRFMSVRAELHAALW